MKPQILDFTDWRKDPRYVACRKRLAALSKKETGPMLATLGFGFEKWVVKAPKKRTTLKKHHHDKN